MHFSRIEEKEKDKIEKYQYLGRELQKKWNVTVKMIPLFVGSVGAIPKQFGNKLKQIGITVGAVKVQKTVLLGTARILRKEPMWKRRLQNKIKELRKDLSQLEASKDKDIITFRHWEKLERKYSIRVKRLNVDIEQLKQRITAVAAKVIRYHRRLDS